MNDNDYIQENVQSTDPFISSLFKELDNRMEEFEDGSSNVEKVSFSAAILPIVIVLCIFIFLLISVL